MRVVKARKETSHNIVIIQLLLGIATMYGTSGFDDPEAAHESRLQVKWLQVKGHLDKFYKNSCVRVYSILLLIFIALYALRGVIPPDLRRDFVQKGNFEIVELSSSPVAYSNFNQFTPYRVLIQSKELVSKYNEGTTIGKVVHPESSTMTLEAVRFKKQLNILKREMRKTLEDEKFSCLPAIALGLPYNVFMDEAGDVYINIEIVEVTDKTRNTSVTVSGLFDQDTSVHEEVLYDSVQVRFTETSTFSRVNRTVFENIASYCLQTYLNNFLIEGASATTGNSRKLRDEL